MNYCHKCNIYINANTNICPLCQNDIQNNKKVKGVFPIVFNEVEINNLVFKLLLFIVLLCVSVPVLINFLVSKQLSWSVLIVIPVIVIWLSLLVSIKKRNNPNAIIFYEVLIFSFGLFFLDAMTGFYKWSINYVIPFLCIGSMLEIVIITFILEPKFNKYFFYLIGIIFLGIIQFGFVIFKMVTIKWASISCLCLSILIIFAFLLFNEKKVYKEISKKFHI